MHSSIFQPEFHLPSHYLLYASVLTKFWDKMMNETQNSAQVGHVPAACHCRSTVKAELRDKCRKQSYKQTFHIMMREVQWKN